MPHRSCFAAVAAASVFTTLAFAQAVPLSSPDGSVRINFTLRDGKLTFDVALKGKPVIETSPIGIVVDAVALTDGVELGKPQLYKTDQSYPWYGVHSTAHDRSNGLRLPLKHKAVAFTLEARAYSDGVAFRFLVPGDAAKSRVPDEATLFRIPAGSTVWYHDFEGHYEATHERKAIADVPEAAWAAPPLTFKLPDNAGYGSITEGALVRYAGMGLQADGKRGFHARLGHAQPVSYPFRLRFGVDEAKRLAQPAAIAGPITTPWRIVIAGADLNTLVNSDIVHAVAPPPDPKLFPQGLKTSWIRPGRAVWRYLDGGEATIEGQKEFARLAHELGFEHNVLEGFWRKWTPQELKDVVDYSRQQGVGVWLWKHRRELGDSASRRAFFQLCKDAGVAGVKLDFFDHEAKEVVELYEVLLKEAAEFQLMVDFHGANKPTGESRTWPNEMTREAIRGMESRKTLRAPHDATLPFTRMLAGHADYTPVHFGDRINDTTWAHQVATAAIFTSPVLIYGANPASMLANPAAEIIKSIPSVWDETIALPMSEIGEVAAFARRRGNTWFVAVLNGAEARSIRVPLTFLASGAYKALMARDRQETAAAIQMDQANLTRGDAIRIDLRSGGGFIARLIK